MHPKIKDYKITNRLAESRSMLVCRGHRLANGESVVLKILKPDAITKDKLVRFRREFEMTSGFDLPGVIKALALEDDDEGLMIVFKDIGGQSLARMLQQAPLSLTDSLELAITLADTVDLIHKQQIIHKDINPSHIIVNTTTKQVNLIGFGLADELPERSVTPLPPSALEGTLAYISPEQTGRMNRPVDYRTDFYSLGVTIYQMLIGKPPFEADDALGMVYSHIAKTPVPPHELNADIPEMVSLIVMKLMSKMADDRYQSASGLKADLEKCLRELMDEGIVRDFELGLEDFSDQLRFSKKLYGREGELDQLLHAFERVSNGERELLLVAGYAGVGKTRLVGEIHKTVIEKQGYFIEGKFDQLQRNVPYFAWIQAFEGLVNYLLMGSEAELNQWKQNIQKAVGSIGRVLTDVIPNLDLIIGPQPVVPELGGVEAQNRFNYVFLQFVKAIATKDRPLVVFLDDLQWIEAASLKLLETLMTSSDISSVLLIGAYRDNEVDALHPLMKGIGGLRKENTSIELLTLRELSEKTVNELIADTLRHERSETIPLARLIYSKTGGNPFFLLQTLKTLTEKQTISFDINSKSWKWDISMLKEMKISDNVVNLMLGRIQQLAPEARYTLPLAACIGYRFDLHTLCIIAEQPEDVALKSLQSALREGLITPVDGSLQFAHDRIQQAAYSLFPDEEKKQVHLEIGRLLLGHIPEHNHHEEQLFTVVDHLNIASELIKTRDERLKLARLNLRAGLKAKASAAFSAAAKYFEAGVGMLNEDSWTTHHNLTLELYTRAAEAESLIGDFERTDQLFAVVIDNATAAVDMVGVYESKMHCYVSQGKLQEVLDVALEILEKLGMSLPGHPTNDDVARWMEETKSLYADIPIEDLINLPKMTDSNKLAIVRVASKAAAAAYSGRPTLCLLFVLTQVSLYIRYGNAIESPYFYSGYALVLCGALRDFDTGYRFGNLALALLDAEDNPLFKSKTLEVICGHVWHFRQHLRATLPYLETGYHGGLETGDLEYAGYNAFFYCCNSFFAGAELQQLEQMMDSYDEAMKQLRGAIAYRWLGPFWQAVQNLLSPSGDPCLFVGASFNQEEMLPILEQTKNAGALAAFYVNRLMLCYLFDNYEQALESSELAEKYKDGMLAMFTHAVSIFYDSLIRIQIYPGKDQVKQAQILERVSANQREIRHLADSAPMNFLHKFYLVEAERMRLAGEDMTALDYYDKAISFAKENKYIQEEALANELAAKFWIGKNKEDFARIYMTRAYRCYESWGAVRKIKDLQKRYLYLLGIKPKEQRAGAALELLDLSTLMKATHAISSNIEMDKLLSEIIHIVIENAGAQSGFLIIEQDGVWQITAKGGIGTAEVKTPLPVGIDESNLVARSVVHFVVRTKESIVLDDAANNGEFISDPYIRREQTRSLLCAPLLSLGRLIGILYLENNLTTQAFTPERIQLLEMLLSQAAISLENARIYEALRESEVKYRRLVDTATEGIWVLGPDTKTTFVNARMAEMLGYQTKEMLNHLVTDFMFEEDRTDHHQKMQNRRQGILERYERRFCHKDGQTIWTLVSAATIFDGHNFQGSFGMVTDITERKQAEDALRKSEALLNAVQRLAKVGGWEYDVKSGKAFWTDELYRIHEIPNDPDIDHLSESPKCYRPEDRPVILDAFRKACEKGEPYDLEFPFTTFKGRHLWIRTTAQPVYEKGKVVRLIGNVIDITERKRAEEELAKYREHLEELVKERTAELEIARNKAQQYLDIAGVILVAIDADRRITLINQKGCEILGVTYEEIIGKDWFDTFIPEIIRQDVIHGFDQLMAGKIEQVEYFENPVLTQDGEERLIAWHNVLLRDESGKIIGTLSSGEDITAQRHSEVQIKKLNRDLRARAVALEAANKELEAFAYSVSHDLRAPLRHIDGFIEMLQKRIAATLDEQSQHYLDTIAGAARRMGALIDDLLSFSRMGRADMATRPVELASLVQEVIRELEPETRGRTIHWQIAALPVVMGDRTMLRVVLVNLLANAVKFTRSRDRAEIEIGCQPAQNAEVVIFVRDNGVGFDMQYVDKLFGVFQRLHRADEFEGTGIGLANVYRIITRHGGRTWAEGQINQGAAFYFSLPQPGQS